MSKPKINKIVIEVGGKKMEFTPDEAKELKSLLSELFGADKTVYVDRYHPYGWPHWTYTLGTGGSLTSGTTTTYNGSAWSGSYDAGSATLALNTRA